MVDKKDKLEGQTSLEGTLHIGRPVVQFNLKLDPPMGKAIRVFTGVKGIKFQHMFEKICLMLLTGELILKNNNTAHKRTGGFAEFMANIEVDMVIDGEATPEEVESMLKDPMGFVDKWI